MVRNIDDLEQHRAALVGHCYRMLGSAVDADDAVQETMVRAWKALAGFDGRSSLRTWLYRIATNVCLDALANRSRRERPIDLGPAGTVEDELIARDRMHWLEPIPDARALPADADPAERAILKQSIRLAFVAALQHLPPKQRAALLLADVLGWSAAEIAAGLDMTVAAVNSALQRARATLATRELGQRAELSHSQAELVDRYVGAFERYDMDALTALLHDDVALNMPPFTLWLRGQQAVREWMLGRGITCRDSKLIPVPASGGPAFAQYHPDGVHPGFQPWSIITLELRAERIATMTFFLDTPTLFPLFGLPPSLP